MAGAFAIEITGPDGAVIRGQILQHLGQMDKWQKETMEAIGRYGRVVMTSRQFQAEGAYLGAGWAANPPSYVNWKSMMFGNTAIGVRTGMMQTAATSMGLDSDSVSWTGKLGGSHTATGKPILQVDATSVRFGVEASQDGIEYSKKFDGRRPIFGDGTKTPPESEQEIGKMLTLPYMAAMHGTDAGDPRTTGFPSSEITKFLASTRMGGLVI